MKHPFPLLGGAVLSIGLLATGLVGTAQAAQKWAGDPMATTDAAAVSVVGFWTSNRSAALKRATPFEPGADSPTLTSGATFTPDGEPGTVAPAHEVGHEPDPDPDPSGITLPKTIGKVFFVDHEGRERWCSATSVQSAHRNVVSTAGRCVHNPAVAGQVMNRWVFIPGHYQDKAPWGIYPGKQAWTHHDFDTRQRLDKDYAFVNVHNGLRLTGVTQVIQPVYDAYTGAKWIQDGLYYIAASQDTGRLGDVVGGQGLAWNQPADHGSVPTTVAFAYPASTHPDGTASYTGMTPKWTYGTPSVRPLTSADPVIEEHTGLHSSFTPGVEGGPFLIRYGNAERLGYVGGVVSLLSDRDGNGRYDMITSPYFDGETADVYRKADEVDSGAVVAG